MSLSLAGNHGKKSYIHPARGDCNAELLYSPLKIILNIFISFCVPRGRLRGILLEW